MKNFKTILTDKQQKYQYYHLEKLINMNILEVKEYYLLIENILFLQKELQKNKQKRLKSIEEHKQMLLRINTKDDHKGNYKETFRELIM